MGKVSRLEDLVVLAFTSSKTGRPNKHGKGAVTATYLECLEQELERKTPL